MKALLACGLAMCVLAMTGCSSGEGYVKGGFDFGRLDKVAIVDITGDVPGEAAKNQIGDYFASELMKKGYVVVERSQVQAVFKEHEFQASPATTQEGAARAGQILNVPVVLIVNIPDFSQQVSMTAKMIDVEDGTILWLGTGQGSTNKTLGMLLGAAGGAVVGAGVSGEGDKLLGGVAGGVLGGAAGAGLSPQKAKVAKNVIKKICKTLPSRLTLSSKARLSEGR